MGQSKTDDLTQEIIKLLKINYSAELFISQHDEPHLALNENGKYKTFSLKSSLFRRYLHGLVRKMVHKVTPYLMESILNELFSLAILSEDKRNVFIRIGTFNDSVVVDLGDADHNVVIINQDGFKVAQRNPTHFVRSSKQLPMPLPTTIEQDEFVRKFQALCNFEVSELWILVLAAALKYLHRDHGSYPILVLEGRQGPGKSLLTKRLKMLIDATHPALSSPPKTAEDILILTNSGYLLTFDNLSGISHEMADIICRTSTGGGTSKRILFTDDSEKTYDLHRPMILNGIDEPSDRPDFVERCLMITLNPLDPSNRKTETELDTAFEGDYPALLGGLYELFSQCLKILPTIQTNGLPRMTDFARMGIAMERVLGLSEGKFLEVYNSNLKNQASSAFWNNPLCIAIYKKLFPSEGRTREGGFYPPNNSNSDVPPTLQGTSAELVNKLFGRGSQQNASYGFTKSPRAFSEALRRAEPLLNQHGIIVDRLNRTGARREILISAVKENPQSTESISL